jgi:pyruvate carboxylase
MSSNQDKLSQIALEAGTYDTQLTRKFAQRKIYERHDPRLIKAVIPGVIERIDTAIGKKVRQGDTLMILEAMKMHNRIKAPLNGTIKAVRVASGEKVTKGQILLEIE